VSVAKACGAEGVHLGQADGSLAEAMEILGTDKIFGRSTHSPEQGSAAEKEGFDYIGAGPVFDTPTKPGRIPAGLEYIRYAAGHLKVPFVAIGGIDETNADTVLKSGARCIAVVRAVLAQADAQKAAEKLKRLIVKG
jgi:thiamine-phosphate pyrophosphorylase